MPVYRGGHKQEPVIGTFDEYTCAECGAVVHMDNAQLHEAIHGVSR